MNIKSDGKVEMAYKVVIEKKYPHPIEKVWSAITKSEYVSHWMEYKADIDLKLGGRYYVDFGPDGSLDGIISTLELHQKLFYAWGDSVVMWEFEDQSGATKVKFSHNGLDRKRAIGLGSGWEAFIDYLEPHLDDQPFPKNRHNDLMKKYEQMVTG